MLVINVWSRFFIAYVHVLGLYRDVWVLELLLQKEHKKFELCFKTGVLQNEKIC